MTERQKRLKDVYDYVRKSFGIHTQEDFANSLHKSRNAITLALNGNEKYLTDKLFKNICEAFPGVFDLKYLVTGEGEMLMKNGKVEKPNTFQVEGRVQMMERLLAMEEKNNEILERQVTNLEKQVEDQRQTIADLRQQLAEERARSTGSIGVVTQKNAFELSGEISHNDD